MPDLPFESLIAPMSWGTFVREVWDQDYRVFPAVDERSFEAIDFLRQFGLREPAFRDIRTPSSQHKDFAPAHSSRNRNAPKRLFAPRCWRWHRRLLAIASAVEKQFLAEKGWLQRNLACLAG